MKKLRFHCSFFICLLFVLVNPVAQAFQAKAQRKALQTQLYNHYNGKSINQQFVQTNDFYIKTVDKKHYEANFKTATIASDQINCRERIRQIICLLDPASETQAKPRVCLEGSANYAHYFETLYDFYPPALQKMFCSLNVINIEKKFGGTAYAGVIEDKAGNMIGAEMGIRQSVLDENLNLQNWSSWKEQLSFGGIADSYSPSKLLPFINTQSNIPVNDFLYFVVAHEFGHIFDFANELNKYKSACAEQEAASNVAECEMAEESWGAISWLTSSAPRPENEFTNRSSLCFYFCDNKFIAVNNINKLYSDLYLTDFISIYATIQPWDDFADSLAYYLMNQNLETKYFINTAQGITFDIMMKVNSPTWQKKYNYISNFLARTDIIYPRPYTRDGHNLSF